MSINNNNNNLIRSQLLNIFSKLSNKSTLNVGLELFKNLLFEYYPYKSSINFIIKEIHDYSKKDYNKKESLILLPLFFQTDNSINFLPKILNILNDNISFKTVKYFNFFEKIFGEIVNNINNINYNKNSNNMNNSDNFFLQFCFDLLSYNSPKYNNSQLDNRKFQQICGNYFLKAFIENSPNNINDQNNKILESISYILIAHFNIIFKKNYYAKNELLNSIATLIKIAKNNFNLYSKETIKKVINIFNKIYNKYNNNYEYLILKKNLLEIIYYVLLYNKEEVKEFFNDIINIVKNEKSDKEKDIRVLSIEIINIIHENNNSNYNENNIYNNKNELLSSMIKSDKDKMKNIKKDFILVQKKYENFFDENTENIINDNNNIDNLNNQINNMEKMNNDLYNTVNNLQNSISQNVQNLNERLDKYEKNNNNDYIDNDNFNNSKNNYINDEKLNNNISNIIKLNENDLIDFLNKTDNENINKINNDNLDYILRRFIIFSAINKDNRGDEYKNILNRIKILRQNDINNFIKLTINEL